MESSLYGLIVKGKNESVPLESVSIEGHIKGYVSGLVATLSYRNKSDNPLEVLFRFPIDECNAVVGLEAKIAGRTIQGVVEEKEQARATYDDAIASGLTAALGEEKSGDIFSLSLGNLPPKEGAQLILKLAGELPLEGETVRFSLPTVLKPRYTPAGSVDPLAVFEGSANLPSASSTASIPAVNAFNLYITNPESIKSVTSPTHDITTATSDNTLNVSLKDTSHLVNKDIVILIESKEPHVPWAIVEDPPLTTGGSNELLSNSSAVMLNFFPGFDSEDAACEFVFVIDRSGSMAGGFINSAKETLILFLKSIPPGCYFNIIGFGSRYEHLFPKSVPYNQSNLDKAMKHATSLGANLGGTELLSPLQFVFGQPLLLGLPRQVFVLTDGSVSNTMACINETKRNAHIARVFTFGIGSGASTELVRGLARAGNGSAEFIKEGDRMQSKVISSLKKALQPSVTEVKLSFSVPRDVSVLQAPDKIPPLFNGDKLVMYGILKGGSAKGYTGTAKLTGNVLGKPVSHKIQFTVGGANSSAVAVVHQLAAKSLIKEWEENDKKKKEVIKLSIESGVISKYTSYVAVDEGQDKPIDGAMKVWDITACTPMETDMLFGFSPQYQSASIMSGGISAPMMAGTSLGTGLGSAMMGGISAPMMHSSGLTGLGHCLGSAPMAPPQMNSWNMAPLRSARNTYSSFDSFGGGPPPPPPSSMYPGAVLPPPPPPQVGGGPLMSNRAPSMGGAYFGDLPTQGSYMGLSVRSIDNDSDDDFSLNSLASIGSISSHSPLISSNKPTNGSGGLSQLISLQSAEGYWLLNESLSSIVGHPLSSLKTPPTGCSEKVWATLLAVAVMESLYSQQRDEWELILMKAERWLHAQSLPSPLETLKKLAIDKIKQ